MVLLESEKRTRCRHCGHVIWGEDIIRYGFYQRVFGPSFVYVKSQCPQCQGISEEFMKQDQWESEFNLEAPPPPFGQ